jgi:hypothetical protein
VIGNWNIFYQKIKCGLGYHQWEYDGSIGSIDRVNFESGYFRFCPCCCKKEQRIIFDFGRIVIWSNVKNITPYDLRRYNLWKLNLK